MPFTDLQKTYLTAFEGIYDAVEADTVLREKQKFEVRKRMQQISSEVQVFDRRIEQLPTREDLEVSRQERIGQITDDE